MFLELLIYCCHCIVLLYALSTLISWAYYGQKSWNYLFGEGRKRTLIFHAIYCSFIVIGSVMNMTSVISITDAMMISMSIPNIIVMYILAPEVKNDLKAFLSKQKEMQTAQKFVMGLKDNAKIEYLDESLKP